MRGVVRWQLVGWSLVAALDFALNRVSDSSAHAGWAAYFALSFGFLGLLVSSVLLAAYSRWKGSGTATDSLVVAAGSIGAGSVWYVANHVLDRAVGASSGEPLSAGLFGRGMLIVFILLAWHAVLLAVRASRRAAASEALAQEARLLALRYQLNPHFLFNVLNSAIALVDENPKGAQTMLTLLSGMLRDTLASTSEETTIERELELVARYVEIQKIRFGERLTVEIDVSDAARRLTLPALLLHSLVENAVKHGLATTSASPVRVRLAASVEAGRLTVDVRNTGHIASDGAGTGVGLRNLTQRLESRYAGRHHFELAQDGPEVRASLRIDAPGSPR